MWAMSWLDKSTEYMSDNIWLLCTKAQQWWQGMVRGAPDSFILQGSRDEQPAGQLFVASHLCFDACQQQRLQDQGQPFGENLSVVAAHIAAKCFPFLSFRFKF